MEEVIKIEDSDRLNEILGQLVCEEYISVLDTVDVKVATLGRGNPAPYVPIVHDLVNIFPKATAFDECSDILLKICRTQNFFVRTGSKEYINLPFLEVW